VLPPEEVSATRWGVTYVLLYFSMCDLRRDEESEVSFCFCNGSSLLINYFAQQ
jgi:hypothetical protein